MKVNQSLQPIRSIFIGGGVNSAVGRAHVSALNIDNKWNIVGGIFSRNVNVQENSLVQYGVDNPLAISSFEEIFNHKSSFDVAHVLTPPSFHVEQITRLLDAGIKVISEKPLVTNVHEAARLAKSVGESSGFLAVIYNYLGYPMIRELAARIRRGDVGDLHEIRVNMPQEGFLKRSNSDPIMPQKWRQSDGEIPVVSLDLGVHVHMMLKYLTGKKPVTVFGNVGRNGNIPGIIDSVNAISTLEDGVVATTWYGKTYLGYRNGLEVSVYGGRGSYRWRQVDPERVFHCNDQGEITIIDRASPNTEVANQHRYERFKVGHPGGFVEALANYYDDIASSISSKKNGDGSFNNDCFGVEESLEGLKWLSALHSSALMGDVAEV